MTKKTCPSGSIEIDVDDLRRVRLDRGGYTRDGKYYGTGQPVYEYAVSMPGYSHEYFPREGRYHAMPTGGVRERYGALRASSRAEAKKKLRETLARFYRGACVRKMPR